MGNARHVVERHHDKIDRSKLVKIKSFVVIVNVKIIVGPIPARADVANGNPLAAEIGLGHYFHSRSPIAVVRRPQPLE